MKRTNTSNEPKKRSPANSSSSIRLGLIVLLTMTHLLVAVVCFQVGFLLGGSVSTSTNTNHNNKAASPLIATTNVECPDSQNDHNKMESEPSQRNHLLPSTMRSLFVGAASVNRSHFASLVEIGVPIDEDFVGNEEVLVLYTSAQSLPSSTTTTSSSSSSSALPQFHNAQDALENCLGVRVILVNPGLKDQCVALMGQWESYHVHKFLRVPPEGSQNSMPRKDLPLRYVHRQINDEDGRLPAGLGIPPAKLTNEYWTMLMEFLSKRDATLERLKPVAEAAAGPAGGKAVVVMLVNSGQSDIFFNFVCAAQSRGIDLSNILMFSTDATAVELATMVGGIHVFDVQDSFGVLMPEKAAKTFGDNNFKRMMLAKVYCVHLVMELGYDVLFQDVDLVWRRHPLEFFTSQAGDYDMLFQDDGGRSSRYAPFSPNSGVYFVKNNARTVYFFNVFVRMGDLILRYRSHQAAMTAIISEHVGWKALRVKVFGRDSEDGRLLPSGYHFHRDHDYMKRMIEGDIDPILFHISWTVNKNNKVLFLQQLGEWYVKSTCHDNTSLVLDPGNTAASCCISKPIAQCHFRDKPSKINCQHSPPIDAGKPSFW